MRTGRRRALIAVLVLALLGAVVASYRSKVLADNEQRFRDRYDPPPS